MCTGVWIVLQDVLYVWDNCSIGCRCVQTVTWLLGAYRIVEFLLCVYSKTDGCQACTAKQMVARRVQHSRWLPGVYSITDGC